MTKFTTYEDWTGVTSQWGKGKQSLRTCLDHLTTNRIGGYGRGVEDDWIEWTIKQCSYRFDFELGRLRDMDDPNDLLKIARWYPQITTRYKVHPCIECSPDDYFLKYASEIKRFWRDKNNRNFPEGMIIKKEGEDSYCLGYPWEIFGAFYVRAYENPTCLSCLAKKYLELKVYSWDCKYDRYKETYFDFDTNKGHKIED